MGKKSEQKTCGSRDIMMMMGLIKGLLYKQALDKFISYYAEYKLILILLLLNIDLMTAYFGSSL